MSVTDPLGFNLHLRKLRQDRGWSLRDVERIARGRHRAEQSGSARRAFQQQGCRMLTTYEAERLESLERQVATLTAAALRAHWDVEPGHVAAGKWLREHTPAPSPTAGQAGLETPRLRPQPLPSPARGAAQDSKGAEDRSPAPPAAPLPEGRGFRR